ncbi:hypothetical protein GCM10023201_27950 [Actinomycetospora corticicola]
MGGGTAGVADGWPPDRAIGTAIAAPASTAARTSRRRPGCGGRDGWDGRDRVVVIDPARVRPVWSPRRVNDAAPIPGAAGAVNVPPDGAAPGACRDRSAVTGAGRGSRRTADSCVRLMETAAGEGHPGAVAERAVARWAAVTGLDDVRRAVSWLAVVTVDSLDLAGQGLAALWLTRRSSGARQPQLEQRAA